MSQKQIEELFELEPEVFDPRTHAALTYVRAFLTEVDGVPVEIEERFTMEFSPREQAQVIAAMKGMFNTNLLVNTGRLMLGRDSCSTGGSCEL